MALSKFNFNPRLINKTKMKPTKVLPVEDEQEKKARFQEIAKKRLAQSLSSANGNKKTKKGGRGGY